MSLYLAIDAGGTKTNCLLADDARILARASIGTVKLMRVSEEEATLRLETMLEDVAAAAGVRLRGVTRTCFGLAGVSSPAARTWARQIIPAKVSGEFLLCGDEEIALDAAFAGGPGILVIAGTGSHVVGRSTSGELFTAGGWGPVLGDEGSGFWIGLEAIRACLREQDSLRPGEKPSCLLGEMQRHWSLHSLAELVAMANQRVTLQHPVPDFADLAPVVARCGQRTGDRPSDALAARVLERAGEELARQINLVFQKMTSAVQAQSASDIEVAFTGSILSHIAPVRTAMAACLRAIFPSARVHERPVDPLDGALWRARKK